MRFCPKCGVSIVEGTDRCQMCGCLADHGPAGTTATSERPGGNPFVSIWLHPDATIRGILDTNPTYLVLPLAAIGGVHQTMSRAVDRNFGDRLSLSTILLIAIVAGPLGGLFGLYVGGALIRYTGKWLGGVGSAEGIRAGMAWGAVPALWGALLWVPAIALAGQSLFASDTPVGEGTAASLLMTAGLLLGIAVTSFWSIFTIVHCLGEAQRFSAWRAFGNLFLAGAIVAVPIILLAAVAVFGLGGPRS